MKKVVSLALAASLLIPMLHSMPASAAEVTVTAGRNFGGHYYELIDSSADWETAVSECAARGGHLVTITSKKEQKAVTQLVKLGTRLNYWLGAEKRNNKFKWITGEKFKYTNFASGQPDRASETGLMMYTYDNPNWPGKEEVGQWNDLNKDGTFGTEKWFGTENFGYICEYEYTSAAPKKQKISSISSKKHQLKIKFNKISGCSGYEVLYSTNKDFSDASTCTVSKNSVAIKNLESKTKYYVKVRTFKKVGGVNFYGSWSKKNSVKVN